MSLNFNLFGAQALGVAMRRLPRLVRDGARSCLVVLALITVATAASGATPGACQEPKLESVSSNHPECHFYKGTRHFRAKEYAAAAVEWRALTEMRDIPKELAYLRADAQNNLGYLYYMGWGVKQDRGFAIEKYWTPAEKAGHDEASYHLCHAYADDNPKLALGYCREALRRYGKLDEENREVIDQLRQHIARLETR